jgi:hypothetical protein
MTDRKVDIWYGIGSGHSIRMEGEIVNGKVRITDQKWLDNIGWDEDYWEYPAGKIPDEDGSYWVSSDDYGWSEINEVPEELLVKGASVIGTDELHAGGVNPRQNVEVTFYDEVSEMNEQVIGKVEKLLAQAREQSKDGTMIFYGTPKRKNNV